MLRTQRLKARLRKLAKRRRFGIALLVAATSFSVGIGPVPYSNVAYACAFDFKKPDRTKIDWILDAGILVRARPDPENPFTYQVVEVLRGDEGTYELPFLVTSVNKRMLASNPDHSVLFRKMPGERWAQVSYIDDQFGQMLALTLDNTEFWGGPDYHPSRFAAFEALQTHPDPKLRELAVRELDKAPYEMLRTLDMKFDIEDLLADLWTPAGYPYQSIRVLLLGFSGDDRARTAAYRYLDRIKDWDGAENIGAFSAAVVELDGASGVEFLNKTFLSDLDQPLDKLQGVVSALAVHRGVAQPDVQAAIDLALAAMVRARPESAPVVAHQFLRFSNWSQAAVLSELVRERRLATTADLLAVSVYVAQARGAGAFMQTLTKEG